MKTNEPIPTLALDDLLSMAASAIEDLLEHTDPNTSYYSGVWADVPGKLRAAMLQAEPVTKANKLGNSPVIPDTWIPVSERMPERKYVLAADFSGKHYSPCQPNTQVGIYADWFDDGNPTWDDGDGNDLHLKQVTHWMLLPEPPREAKDDINALIPLVSRSEQEGK
ncbi:DUF551 domain-containing protein [Klebsiella indica]|uniref:DUF551 domain-containing protein n=1 Tax=Klebsiella indica TaxID=2582917 RepID=UPI0031B678A5